MKPGFRTTGRAWGFTLIELMIVIGILAVITGAVVASFAGGLRIWSAASSFNRIEAEVVPGLEIFQRDVANSFSFYAIDYTAERKRISFASIIKQSPDGEADGSRIAEIRYFFDRETGELVRKSAAFPAGMEEGDINEESVIGGLEDLELSYFQYDPEDGGRWGDEMGKTTNLPEAVRIELWFEEERPAYSRTCLRRGAGWFKAGEEDG
jgi:prepilin-type N-terminal cleavage/methylation domain-containing protein